MRKKRMIICVIGILCVLMIGCSAKKEKDTNEDKAGKNQTKEENKKEVTIPGEYLGGLDGDSLKEIAGEGISDVKEHGDGSVTYTMNEEAYSNMKEEYRADVDEAIQSILEAKESYPSIQEITYNKEITKFSILVDGATYSEEQMQAAYYVYIPSVLYQLINGEKADEIQVTVEMKDKDTNEVLGTFDSSDLQ